MVQHGIDTDTAEDGPLAIEEGGGCCCAELPSDAFDTAACISSFSTVAWWRNCSNRSWFWRFHFVLWVASKEIGLDRIVLRMIRKDVEECIYSPPVLVPSLDLRLGQT